MFDKKKAGSVITASALMAALALSQVSPFMAYAEEGETVLNVADTADDAAENTEEAAEEETEEKKEYTQLETTNLSDVSVTAVDVSKIVEAVMPSMVTISESSVREFMNYFGGTEQVEVQGAATGFIIAQDDDEIMIATNNHVVEDSTEVSVCFAVKDKDGEEVVVPAKVKGTDPTTDLAVVSVSPEDIPEEVLSELKIAVLGSSDNMKVGQTAITIGNSLGEGLNVTAGIVSAVDVDIMVEDGRSFTEFQTDGAANMGQSGGAVFNADGEVIGIFNAGMLDGDNIGYAISISTAIPVLQNLVNRETREVSENHGYMGIMVVPVSTEASEMYNIPQGAYVYEVSEGSPAEEAGLQKGDIITGFDGLPIDSQETLLRRINYYSAGETVEVVFQRANGNSYEEMTAELTLEEGEDTEDAEEAEPEKNDKKRDKKDRRDGSDSDVPEEQDGEDADEDDSDAGIVAEEPTFEDLYPDAPEGLGDILDEIFGGGGYYGNGDNNGSPREREERF